MIEDLILFSGNDIQLSEFPVKIHQPTIREVGEIGEESFFMGCQILNFSKEILQEEDRLRLSEIDDFDILMAILSNKEGGATEQQDHALAVLKLMFPTCSIVFRETGISLMDESYLLFINKTIFADFRQILRDIFCLHNVAKEEFKPANKKAEAIAEKIKKGREKLLAAKGKNSNKIAVFARYMSILAIGLNLDLRVFLDHTVFQIYDEFKRFQLRQNFEMNIKARLAGATDLEEVDNWMEDLYS